MSLPKYYEDTGLLQQARAAARLLRAAIRVNASRLMTIEFLSDRFTLLSRNMVALPI
jgi:hypothetical protein